MKLRKLVDNIFDGIGTVLSIFPKAEPPSLPDKNWRDEQVLELKKDYWKLKQDASSSLHKKG